MKTRVLRRSTRSATPQVNLRATVISHQRADTSTSRQVALQDEFLGAVGPEGANIILPTPYNVGRLYEIIEESNMVRQCIDAYVTNTVMTGWEIGPTRRGRAQDDGEGHELLSFIERANSEESLSAVMEKVIRDRESVGFGFLEVIRDAANRVSLLRHAPSLYTRLCAKHKEEQLVEYTIQRGRRVSVVKEYRRFRRFYQIVSGKQVWFKEFGDARRMDYTNGAFEGESGFNPKNLATEIIHFKLPSNESYGVPRWINQLPSILGSREAEEVNMRYFQDNTVPPMMLLVGGGRLTNQSYRELTRALNNPEDLGTKRQNRIMLLEAVGESDSMDGKTGTIDLKVEKLSDTRQSDGLFSSYDQSNMSKVRSSFRLPPITVGMSQDVNFATASTSAFVAESQVFAPARDQIDEVLNNLLVNGIKGLGLATVKLISRTPSITSPEMLIKTLTALNVMGAVTPRMAQQVANKMLQIELEQYPEPGSEDYEEWMDKPIIFVTRGSNTQPEQANKDPSTKQVEEDGDVTQQQPKHGEE